MLPDTSTIEAEILGACLMHPGIIDLVAVQCDLQPGDFSFKPYSHAYSAILELHDQDGTVTPATLEAKLNTSNAAGVVEELAASAGSVGSIAPNAKLLRETALRRLWDMTGLMLQEAAARNDEQLVARAEQLLATPTITAETYSQEQVAEAGIDFLDSTDAVGISTGFVALDNKLGGGLRRGDSTALGAWTSMGKSVLVDQILTNASLLSKASCHAYINEMSVQDRSLRMLARQSSIPYSRIVIRDLSDDEKALLRRVARKAPFGITDCSQWSASQISRHIRANRWDLCAVDLLHNMEYERESELHRMVSVLAAGARSAGAHLILVCQFNEARAQGEVLPRPVSRDLRGSGMIKNVCANVLLLHREQRNDSGFVTKQPEGAVFVDKARHGQLGAISVVFDADSMSFDQPRSAVREVAA